jgi:hypothetical protein
VALDRLNAYYGAERSEDRSDGDWSITSGASSAGVRPYGQKSRLRKVQASERLSRFQNNMPGLGTGLGFTRRRQSGPCDHNCLSDSLGDLEARMFGVVPSLKHERENGLHTLIEDIEAVTWVGHSRDIAHRAVLKAEARQF